MLPTDDELNQARLRTEDALVERKTFSDSQDWVKTVVGFANSVPFDRFGLLYIGLRTDGSIEGNKSDLDHVQRTLRKKLDAVFPPINYTARVLSDGSQKYLCVIVPGSPSRPHFAGPAYVRVGSETIKASQQQFDRMVSERNSKVYKILQWEGKPVRIDYVRNSTDAARVGRVSGTALFHVVGCTEFAVTLRDANGNNQVLALDRVEILEEAAPLANIVLEVRN